MSTDLISAVDALTAKLDQLFGVPDGADFAALFSFGLVLPLSSFLVALAVGKLLSMLKEY